MTVTFSFSPPARSPSYHNFYAANAKFDPPVGATKQYLETDGLKTFVDFVYHQIQPPIGDYISRRGRKSKVTYWQCIISTKVFLTDKRRDPRREGEYYVASHLYGRYDYGFKRFFQLAFEDCLIGSGLFSASVSGITIFELQIRAYRPR